jgi:signal transduction histidine kinase
LSNSEIVAALKDRIEAGDELGRQGANTAPSNRQTSRRDKGTMGIGLATIRERIRFAGGQLDIKSRKGGGTEIVFTLPVGAEKENRNALQNRLGG